MNINLKSIIFSAVCLLLISCGQKGDLYLPSSELKKNVVTIEPKKVANVKKKTSKNAANTATNTEKTIEEK